MSSARPWRPSSRELELSRQRHARWASYGDGTAQALPVVADVARTVGAAAILDYGCGKGGLVEALRSAGMEAEGFDPAVRGWHREPVGADLVVCLHVLDIVESSRLQPVLDRLFALAGKAVFAWITVQSPMGRRVPPLGLWLSEFARRGHIERADVDLGVLEILARKVQQGDMS